MSVNVKKGATGGAGGEGNQNSDPKLKAGGAGEGDGAGGDGGEGDGDGAGDGDAGGESDPRPRSKSVAWEDHKRALDDMNKFKRELQKERDAQKAQRTKDLEAQNRYKELYEAATKERDEAQTEAKRIRESFVNERKYSAVKTAAVAAGLRQEALDDLEATELDLVEVETTSKGRLNVLGVNEQIKKLQQAKPHWFGGKKAPNVNSGNPKVNGGGDAGDGAGITMDQVRALEKKARTGTTADKQAYHDAVIRFRNTHGRRLDRGAIR